MKNTSQVKENSCEFSILIPVFKTEKYLARALKSVEAQDYASLEIIVVNDGSPDGDECKKVCEQYARKLDIKYIEHKENKGLYEARLTGVKAAAGENILFLDSDDRLLSDALKILHSHIYIYEKNYDYIYFRSSASGGAELVKDWEEYCKEGFSSMEGQIKGECNHTVWSKCYRASFLKKVYSTLDHFYCNHLEDYFQSTIIEFYARKRIFIEDRLYMYYRNIGLTGREFYNDVLRMEAALKSYRAVTSHLCAFFAAKGEKRFQASVRRFILQQYFYFLSETKDKNVKRLINSEIEKLTGFSDRLRRLSDIICKLCKKVIKKIIPCSLLAALKRLRNK